MKILSVLWFLFLSISIRAQTASEYLNKGLDKANVGDFKGAVADFTNAISLDSKNPGAYYNRGTAKLKLSDFKGAIADFNAAASIDPSNRKIFSNRGIAKLSSDNLKEAIGDFDMAIKIDANSASDYFMRGQAKLGIGDNAGGCNDLRKASALGHKGADGYISQYCKDSIEDLRERKSGEYLRIDWPDSEGWKVASNNASGAMKIVELLRNNETFENWTEIGTMMVYSSPGPMPPIEEAMNFMVKQANGSCPSATVTLLEKDEKSNYPWIIFKVECAASNPESQVWQIVEGKQDMFINFRAVKQKNVPEDLKSKWVKFFKTASVQKS